MTKEIATSYASGTLYYKDLAKYLLTNTENDFGKISHRIVVLNPAEVVASLDSGILQMKPSIVSFYNLLWRSYKDALNNKRKRTINQIAKGSALDDMQPMSKRIKQESPIDSNKSNRVEYLPDYFLKCTSRPAKVAIMLYMTPSYTESIRKTIIFAILNGHMEDMSIRDLVALSCKSVGELRKICPTPTHNEAQRLTMIKALLEIAHITRDRAIAKLAMDVDAQCYLDQIQDILNKQIMNDITVFEPIINKYLKQCIAMNVQDMERQRLHNQFRINAKELIENLIESLPPPTDKGSATANKAVTFDETQTYYHYKGAPNFAQDIVVTNFVHENTTYVIETYNDCLFDVIGSFCEGAVDKTTGTKQSYSDLMLKNKTWEERLSLLPFRAKVKIGEITGKELNNLVGITDVAITWLDKNGFACRRIVRKRDKKPTPA